MRDRREREKKREQEREEKDRDIVGGGSRYLIILYQISSQRYHNWRCR